MILQYTRDNEGWYYFFENKEVYEELAASEDYTQPDPEIAAILAERLRREPEKFQVQQAAATDYYHFRFRYLETEKPAPYLPYRILYYPWDDEGYFYMVDPDVFEEKTISERGVTDDRQFEVIPLAQEKELLFELGSYPGKFDIIKGASSDFFYQKFRIKSL